MAKRNYGRSPKERGVKFEREICRQAEAMGLPAQRAWGSDGRSMGLPAGVDCLVGGFRVQARRREITKTIAPGADVDVVVTRRNRGEALVVMRYSDWLYLIGGSMKDG